MKGPYLPLGAAVTLLSPVSVSRLTVRTALGSAGGRSPDTGIPLIGPPALPWLVLPGESPRTLEPSHGLSDPVLLTWELPWPSLFPVTLSSGPSPLRYTSSLTKTLQRTLGETTTFWVTVPIRRRGTEAQTRQAMSLLRATTRPHTQVPGSLPL